jgi:hypothetical protein
VADCKLFVRVVGIAVLMVRLLEFGVGGYRHGGQAKAMVIEAAV